MSPNPRCGAIIAAFADLSALEYGDPVAERTMHRVRHGQTWRPCVDCQKENEGMMENEERALVVEERKVKEPRRCEAKKESTN